MTVSMTIIKKNNTHDMKLLKSILKKYIYIDEYNNISMSLKPHTMILKIQINCNSYQYYFDMISALISHSNYYMNEIGDLLLGVIIANTYNCDMVRLKSKYRINYSVSDNDMKCINLIIFPIKVNIYEIIENSTINKLISTIKIYYNYDNKNFILSKNIDNDLLKIMLIHLLLKYNNGSIIDCQKINIPNYIMKSENRSKYFLKCTYAGNMSI